MLKVFKGPEIEFKIKMCTHTESQAQSIFYTHLNLNSQSLYRFLVRELEKSAQNVCSVAGYGVQPTILTMLTVHKNLPVPAWLRFTFIHSKSFSVSLTS